MEIRIDPLRSWPLLALLSFALAGCEKKVQEEGSETQGVTPAIPVETTLPSRSDIYAVYSATAPIEAFADATVIAKVGGEVREVFAEEGDDVASGQVLARLDGERLRLEVQQAEANLQKLRRDYQRNLDLKGKNLISEGDFEKIRFEMDALQATYDLARLELGYTEIRAPITGVVSERFIKAGNTIDANQQTFQVTSLEPLVSYLHVPEREYRRIEAGQSAGITVDALQGVEFTGIVARISPVVDPQTGTFKITIEVSDPSRKLKPGMFGRVSIVHDMHANALQIPRSAVLDEAGQTSVFVVIDGMAERRNIRTGYVDAGRVEVLHGIGDDDQVVIVGQTTLKQGTKVSVINANSASLQAAEVETVSP